MDRKLKNILILCNIFPPACNQRIGYLCRYLPALGWNPVVISEFLPLNIYADLAKGQNVTYINYYFSENKTRQFLKHSFVWLADFLFNYKDHILEKKAEKIIRENNISMIMASASSLYTLPAAHKLSRKYNIPLMVDLRDIFEQSSNNELVINKRIRSKKLHNFVAYFIRKKLTRQRNKVLRKAAAITTVSPWHVETLSQYNSNVKLIYNGYNPEIFYPQIIKNEKFTLTFTGRLYSPDMCDPSLLFEAVKNLSDAKKISPALVRLQFYLKDDLSKQIIQSFSDKYQVAAFVDILDTVQNAEIPQILNASAILLVLSNQAKDHKGIMGTKIFEYLAVEKPILCVRNDEDCLESTINAANAGLAASTVEETEKFILEHFSEWQQNGYTRQAVHQDYIRQFSRKCQAGQFVELFDFLAHE